MIIGLHSVVIPFGLTSDQTVICSDIYQYNDWILDTVTMHIDLNALSDFTNPCHSTQIMSDILTVAFVRWRRLYLTETLGDVLLKPNQQ